MKKRFCALINAMFSCLFLFTFIIFLSCGGGGGDGGGSTPTPTPTPVTPTYSSQDWQNLYDYNASTNNGYTIRWPSTVKTYNVYPEYFGRWAANTDGKIEFDFVSNQPSDGISVYIGSDLPDDAVGSTLTYYYPSTGKIARAVITIHPDHWNETEGPYILTHEAGHALGFVGHTTDGCIMDERIGARNYISDAVARVMTHLYSYSPHTNTKSYFLKEAIAEFPTIERDDGSTVINTPHGDYYVKKIDEEISVIGNGPLYTGRVEPLPELKKQ